MTTLDLTLPEEVKSYIEKQAAQQGYADPGSFIAALVEAHQHRQIRSDVEARLLEVIDGPFDEWTDEDLLDIRREGEALISLRREARRGASDSNL
jgi:hypothetical protein